MSISGSGHQVGTDLNPISLSQLDKLIETSFNSVSKDTHISPDFESRFTKVGGLTYKFIAADPLESQGNNAKLVKDAVLSTTFEQEMRVHSSEQTDSISDVTHKPTDQDKDYTLYAAISHGLIIRLLPQNPTAFLHDLNSTLRNFVKDAVSIIKNLDNNEYQFKFGKLDLEVHIRQDLDKLIVKLVTVKNGEIPMLTEEDRIQLINLLQQDLPDEEIEVSFVEIDQETPFQDGSQKQDKEGNQSQNSENSDDSDLEHAV